MRSVGEYPVGSGQVSLEKRYTTGSTANRTLLLPVLYGRLLEKRHFSHQLSSENDFFLRELARRFMGSGNPKLEDEEAQIFVTIILNMFAPGRGMRVKSLTEVGERFFGEGRFTPESALMDALEEMFVIKNDSKGQACIWKQADADQSEHCIGETVSLDEWRNLAFNVLRDRKYDLVRDFDAKIASRLKSFGILFPLTESDVPESVPTSVHEAAASSGEDWPDQGLAEAESPAKDSSVSGLATSWPDTADLPELEKETQKESPHTTKFGRAKKISIGDCEDMCYTDISSGKKPLRLEYVAELLRKL